MKGRCLVAAGLALVLAAPASADFEATTFEGLGGDADRDRIIDGARAPAQVGDGRVRLRLRVTGLDCRAGVRYAWELDDQPLDVERLASCEFRAGPIAEGVYEVALHTDGGDGEPEIEREVTVVEHLVVSLGDSVASGEGNPDVPAGFRRARWLQSRCHRSMLSGHARAALSIERAAERSAVTFVPLACSGATIRKGLRGRYKGIDPDGVFEPPQADILEELRPADAVLLSVGANDAYFGEIVQFCLFVKNCQEKRFDPDDPTEEANPPAKTLDEAVSNAIRELPDGYAALDEELTPAVPPERVLIVEYFDPTIGPDQRFCRVDLLLGAIERDESQWAHERVLGPLNDAVAKAADEHGWTLVDGVDEAFAGHGICARGRDRWVRTMDESFFRHGGGLAFQRIAGTLHPSGPGHEATARLIRPRLAAVLSESVPDDAIENPPEPDDGWFGTGTTIALIAGGGLLLLGVGWWAARRLIRSR